jgi:hydroxyethylthiazole kinase-like uncharacterized protein yjeF
MRSAHTVAQVRAAEAELLARLPDGALMQRAAHGLAVAVADLLGAAYGARVLLLVGSGDNGGDALWAGSLLARRGAAVEAVLLSDRAHPAGLAALRAAGGRVVGAGDAARPDVLVDGIVGIGGSGGLREDAVAAVGRFAGVPVVAVDLPSGVEADSGETPGAHVTADVTVTFGTHKACHLVDPAAAACGAVHLVDLGLDLPEPVVTSLQPGDVAALLPVPAGDAQKYSRGVVGVRTGSAAYPGAGVLSTAGAGCGLAGMVRYAGSARDAVLAAHPEVVPGEGRVQAWVVGSGGGDEAEEHVAAALADGVPTVLDADALRFVRPGTLPPDAVLTPHAGELASLLDRERADVEEAPLRSVRDAVAAFGCVVLLKGPRTLVAHPDGRVRANATGTSWLATAGSGDVLAGLVGALLAAGLEPFDAAAVGAWLHGAAATEAGGPLTAGRVATAIPRVVGELALG